MTRRINDAGLNLLKSFEGLRLKAYKCPADVWTISYGVTGPNVKEGMEITKDEAERMLSDMLRRFEAAVEGHVRVKLTDNQFAALVLFAYNVGVSAFLGSTLLKLLNGKAYDAVPEQMRRWNKVKGRVSRGLVRRREAEIALWNTPDLRIKRDG